MGEDKLLPVGEHSEKVAVPKFASFVMLPPMLGLSTIHSADDRAAPFIVSEKVKLCPLVLSVSNTENLLPAKYDTVTVTLSPGETTTDDIVTLAAG